MGAYVTQSRFQTAMPSDYKYPNVQGAWNRAFCTGSGGGFTWNTTTNTTWGNGNVGELQYPRQITTSYRSRSRAEHDDDPLVTDAESSVDFIRKLAAEESKRSSSYDTGHTFDTQVATTELSHPYVDTNPGYVIYPGDTYKTRYQGPLVPKCGIPAGADMLTFWPRPTVDTSYYSTSALARTAPTNPHAQLSTALMELYRDRLPSLPGAGVFKNFLHPQAAISALGGEFLNVVFGFEPLANDIAQTAYAVTESKRLIDQYLRDSGKLVRRSAQFDPIIKNDKGSFGNLNLVAFADQGTFNGCFLDQSAKPSTWESQEYTKVYFKGAYTYFVPENKGLLGKLDHYASLAQKLVGIELTPESVWDASPFSWLVDWKVNIGDLLHNVSQFSTDGLVLKYGYLMVETHSDVTVTHPGVTFRGTRQVTGPIYAKYSSVRKQRIKATPYGFGLNPSSFTDRQWSILAALGLSKGNAKALR